jgi:4-aminobutyrate aminotransferase-like enzyme
LSLVGDTSTFLKIELERVAQQKGLISDIRGYGTFIGFDVPNENVAEKLTQWFK